MAAVADELKILLRAETRSAVNQLRKAQQETGGLEKKMLSAVGSAAKMAVGFASLGGAAYALGRTIKGSFDAFADLELAQNRMAAAVELSGENVDSIIPMYNALAAEMQDLTVVSGGAATELIALAQSMGVTSQDMDGVVKGAIGLSRALGMDTTTALRAVTNAMEGNFSQLQRYLPELRTATTDAEKMAMVQEALSDTFEMAQRETDTISGTMAQYRNAVDSVREAQGEMLARTARPLLEWARDFALEMAESAAATNELAGAKERLSAGVASGADQELVAQARLADLERQRAVFAQQMRGMTEAQREQALETIDRQIAAERQRLSASAERQRLERQLAQQTEERDRRETEAALAEAQRREEAANALSEWLQKVNSAYDQTTEARLAAIDAEIEWFENAQEEAVQTRHMFEPILEMLEEQRAQLIGVQEEYEKTGKLAKNSAAKQAEAAEDVEEDWGSAASKMYSAMSSTYGAWMSLEQNRNELLMNNLQRELEQMQEQNERSIEFKEALGYSEEELQEVREELAAQEEEKEREIQKKKADLAEKQFNRQKLLSVAEATQAGAVAFVSALKLGSIAGPIAAGTIAAMTAGQIGMIQATKFPGFARGGDFVTSGPQAIVVGDNPGGRERVRIDPMPDNRPAGGAVVNVGSVSLYGAGSADEFIEQLARRMEQLRAQGIVV